MWTKSNAPMPSETALDETGIITPEVLLPEQTAAHLDPSLKTGEERLAWAVLERAVADIIGFACATKSVRKRIFFEALDWMASDWDTHLHSFASVCYILNLDPRAVREAVTGRAAYMLANGATRKNQGPHKLRQHLAA